MVVIAENREYAGLRMQVSEHPTEIRDIAAHRIAAREVVAGQKNQMRILLIDYVDCRFKPRQILVAINMKVANLASDYPFERRSKVANR